MGTFGKSFTRELGKNTGKFVSNAIFGDSWSTPHRHVGSRSVRVAETRIIHERRPSAAMERVMMDASNSRQDRLLAIDKAVLENVDKIAAIKVPYDEEEIIQILEQLTPGFKSVRWYDEDDDENEGRIRNQYSNAILYKYEMLIKRLEEVNPHSKYIKEYSAHCRSAIKHRIESHGIKKYVLSTNEQDLRFELETLADMTERIVWKWGASFSAKYEYEKNVSIISKLREAIKLYKKEHGESALTVSSSFLATKNRMIGMAKKLIGLLLSLFWMFCILLAVWMSKTTQTNRYLVLFGLIVLISGIVYLCIRSAKSRKMKIERLNTERMEKLEQESEKLKKRLECSQVTNIAQKNAENEMEDNTYVYLDENNRIDNRLKAIWDKYTSVVDHSILERRPIYAAEGVKDSILFVGVNPSYSPEDDSKFEESNSKCGLLYNSFYLEDSAPQYFKELEQFAKQLGCGYSHLNLLYARENDRDVLLSNNSDFIREQLELTHDTIMILKPRAIVFFTKYCKDLIFGENRWTTTIQENNAYKLLGTEIPVFFSEDIVFMTEDEKNKMHQQIQQKL